MAQLQTELNIIQNNQLAVDGIFGSAGTPATTGPATSQPLQYVALGDSYSSGEGLGPFLPGTDTATDSCHRSTQAYSQYVMPKPNWCEACSMQTEAARGSTRCG